MGLEKALIEILENYKSATKKDYAGNTTAHFIRHDARDAVSSALSVDQSGLIVEGSAGRSQWAAVPWIAIFDPAVTSNATHGYYVVYLFNVDEKVVHLSLNQGTTNVRTEYKKQTREVLKERAELIRYRIADLVSEMETTNIDLGSDDTLPGDYAAGHVCGFSYKLHSIPDQETLEKDLQQITHAYLALTFRGGLDQNHESVGGDQNDGDATDLTEIRRYRSHRRIERNSKASKLAKKYLGTVCQACDFDFGELYGSLGDGFIEAHHLKPLSTLEEGVAVAYDPRTDFAVLCSNCHRMIHRSDDPSDLDAFKDILRPSY